MKCEEFKEKLIDLFDKNPETLFVDAMTNHMLSCSMCNHDYNEMNDIIVKLTTPSIVSPSYSGRKELIIKQLKTEEIIMKKSITKMYGIKRWHKQLIVGAASALIILSIVFFTNYNPFVVTVQAAEKIMLKSITAMESLRSMFISMDVRSKENENFDFIGEDYNFIEYKFWKQFSGNQPWRIEKPGRIVTYNGDMQYLYLPDAAYAVTAGKEAGFVEWIKIFLEPKKILEREIAFAKTHKAVYNIDKTHDEIILSVSADALGDFHNNYLKNKSVLGSDNSRIYVFDKKTMLLKSFELSINDNAHSTIVIKITSITYNIPIVASTFSIQLPTGTEWRVLKDPGYVKAYTNITSKHAAKKFFKALHNEEYDSIAQIWDAFQITDTEKLEELKSIYGGVEIISIGESFKSGLYPGEFVPYKIKYKSGKIEEFNLALRNDNPTKTWEIDGGL